MLKDALADARMQRLADTLTTVSLPLARLFEYAGNLEKRVNAHEAIQATCIAAAILAEARHAQNEIAASLAAVQEAASEVLNF